MTGTNSKRDSTSTDKVDMLPNLRRTPHGYTYLKTVPKDLQPVIGKTVIKQALGRDFKVVKVLWAQLEAENTRLFHDARQQIAQGRSAQNALEAFEQSDPRTRRLKVLPAGRDGLAEQLSQLYLAGLSADYSARKAGERWHDAEEPDALTHDLDAVLRDIKTAVITGDVAQFKPAVEQLALWRGYKLVDESGHDLQALTYEFLRAALVGCQVLAARQRGEFAEPPASSAVPPLPAAWELDIPPQSVQKAPRLSDVTPIYVERLSIADTKTQTTSLSRWERFVEFCRDKPLSNVTSTDVYDFLDNRLHAAERPWSMSYCSVAVRGLIEAFALAKTRGLCTHNPAKELDTMPKISASEEKKRKKPRYPYSIQQLNTLFASAWYDPDAENWAKRVRWDIGARYWIPLLCLYHGLRIREALQLHVHDVEPGTLPLLRI
jgi:hypothetical protein